MTSHDDSAGCSACANLLARERAARTAAEAAGRAKDEFFLTLSHELRGPLSAILGWVSLLREGKLDDATAARALEAVERSAKAEARLIEDMLDVSRIIGGTIRLALRPVDLATLVAATIETVRPAIDEKAIHVEMDVRQVVDRISADPDRLRQVMENLLLNAIKFTPNGGQIVVRLDGNAQCATIAVRDTGRGIRADLLPHLFKQFWQRDPAATRLGGLGLGLGIVERLLELHGGTIEATSDGEGKGATFTVTLPTHLGERVECPEVPALPSIVTCATPSVGRPWIVCSAGQRKSGEALR
jgi:signal transduction histidine kinase